MKIIRPETADSEPLFANTPADASEPSIVSKLARLTGQMASEDLAGPLLGHYAFQTIHHGIHYITIS